MTDFSTPFFPIIEKLFTIKEAAKQLGIPYWKLNQAVRLGIVPHYTILNTRKLVKLSEVMSALQVQKGGGQ